MGNINIYGTFESQTTDHKLALANQIYDEEQRNYQSDINKDLYDRLGTSSDNSGVTAEEDSLTEDYIVVGAGNKSIKVSEKTINDFVSTDISVEASTLEAGSEASVEYDKNNNIFTFNIPKGADGAQGQKGDKGDPGEKGDPGPAATITTASSDTVGGIKIGYSDNSENSRNYAVKLDVNNNAYVSVPWTDTTYNAGTNISINDDKEISCSLEIPSYLPNPCSLQIIAGNVTTSYTGFNNIAINLDDIFSKKLSILTNPKYAGEPGIFFTTDGETPVNITPKLTKEYPDAIVIVPGTTSVQISQEGNDVHVEQNVPSLYGSVSGVYKCFCISWVAEIETGIQNELQGQVVFINGAIYD